MKCPRYRTIRRESKKSTLIRILKGSAIGLSVNLISNLITFGRVEILNVLVGVIIGAIAYTLIKNGE